MLLQTRIYLLLCLLSISTMLEAQVPMSEGERMRYAIQIDMGAAGVGGICSMLKEAGEVKSVVVNDFGVSLIQFVYKEKKDRVKILYATEKLNKWYIRRLLKHDLLQCIHNLQKGIKTYENRKRGITYGFEIIADNEP